MPAFKDRRLLVFCVTLALFGVAFVTVSSLAYRSLLATDRGRNELTERYARMLTLTNTLRYAQAHENEMAIHFVLTGDRKFYDEIFAARALFADRAQTFRTIDASPVAGAFITALQDEKARLDRFAAPGLQGRLNGVSAEETHRFFETNGKELGLTIAESLDAFFRYQRALFTEARAAVDRSVKLLQETLLVSGILMISGFLVIVLQFVKLERYRKTILAHAHSIAAARKDVLETVAHDLKNPLAAMMIGLDLAKSETERRPHPVADVLEAVTQSARAMHRLITDLLDHSKIESGHLTLNPKTSDVVKLAGSIVRRFEMIAKTKHIDLTCDMPAAPLYADVDETRLDQLLSNLVGNAIKFTPEKGRVSVSLSRAANDVLFRVQDNGAGMERAEMDHAFDRYWQVRKTASKGTGLGLAISKAIADAHRGKLWVESEVGKGSTFYFSLPSNA